MYTLTPSFVEIYLKVIKLCCFYQDNPHFSAFERHAELAASEVPGLSKLSKSEHTGLSHLGYHVWGAMLESTVHCSRSLRQQMS